MVFPKTRDQWQILARFLQERAHVQPTGDMQMIAWMNDEKKISLVVGLNAWIGKTCQIHVAMVPGYKFTPQDMLKAVFEHVFNVTKREVVFGIVNSKNEAAMRYDLHLGFKEVYRENEVHDDGGDLVVLKMTRGDCRYLQEQNELPLESANA